MKASRTIAALATAWTLLAPGCSGSEDVDGRGGGRPDGAAFSSRVLTTGMESPFEIT